MFYSRSRGFRVDARVVPHVMHAVTHGISRIIVLSADTDVFVLMVFYWNVLHSHGLSELWVKAGAGDSTRFIPIHVLAAQIGENVCQFLPAVHVLTGCDYTSKIGTKHAALITNPEHYLEDFGTKMDESTIDKAEEYLTQVLKKGAKFKKMDQPEVNCTTTVNLWPYSSYCQVAPQQDYISSELFTPQTRWYPSFPPYMIAWIQHSMGLRRLTTSLHQRWTPT